MKFFFPDSFDLVDPSFDFVRETRADERVRQRDDRYAHEMFGAPPYDGVLVSWAMVEGYGGSRYTTAQRFRFHREGVRRFFRLDDLSHRLETLGDCGAFSYVKEPTPPLTVPALIEFYEAGGFDYGVSLDHVILGFSATEALSDDMMKDWKERQEFTLEAASQFLSASRESSFEPIGVAQGWSPGSYAASVEALEKMGYKYIGVGGLVPLRSAEILAVLVGISEARKSGTKLHLFGVTRLEHIVEFQRQGVVSFDSTSPLRRAFKDEKENYYSPGGSYPAIRVPQTDGNNMVRKRIASGEISQDEARRLEKESLRLLRLFDRDQAAIGEVLGVLKEYSSYLKMKDKSKEYERVLEDRAWRDCSCEICQSLGIDVILFRGAERNRRRGFHNVHFLYDQLCGLRDSEAREGVA